MFRHTHDGFDWLMTMNQYYYCSNNGNQEASAQYILDTRKRSIK